MVENGNGEKRWRKWLFNEISLFTGVVAIVISIMYWVTNPMTVLKEEHVWMRAQIETIRIKTDDLENSLATRILQIQVQLDRVEARQIEVLKGLAQLQAVHK